MELKTFKVTHFYSNKIKCDFKCHNQTNVGVFHLRQINFEVIKLVNY